MISKVIVQRRCQEEQQTQTQHQETQSQNHLQQIQIQQPQTSGQQQIQNIQVSLSSDRVLKDQGSRTILFCEGSRNSDIYNEYISRGACWHPSGQWSQQPQSGGCKYKSIYLQREEFHLISENRSVYVCQ